MRHPLSTTWRTVVLAYNINWGLFIFPIYIVQIILNFTLCWCNDQTDTSTSPINIPEQHPPYISPDNVRIPQVFEWLNQYSRWRELPSVVDNVVGYGWEIWHFICLKRKHRFLYMLWIKNNAFKRSVQCLKEFSYSIVLNYYNM